MKFYLVTAIFFSFFMKPSILHGNSNKYKLSTNSEEISCDLTITKVIVGDCEYGLRTGNVSKVLVAIFLTWSDPPAGSKIRVEMGGQTVLFDPFEKGNPPYVQFVFTPDGQTKQIKASFTIGNCFAAPVNTILPTPCEPPSCTGVNSIGGTVFFDYNGNGIKDASESGNPGIEMRLYDDTNKILSSTYTGTNGVWAIKGLNTGQKVRVEFDVPSTLFDGNPGSDNGTRVQFAEVGDCGVDLGIFQILQRIDENPWMVTSCFSKGDANNPASTAANEPTLVANLYNTPNGGPLSGPNGNYYLASASETGAVWGISYQRETNKLFSSAFLKRQCSVGPGGLSAIYLTDLQDFIPSPPINSNFKYYGKTSILLRLEDFGISAGDIDKLKRDLPTVPTDGSHDVEVFDKVGKWGLGDMDMNDNGDTLFVVNLYNRSIVAIHIKNPIQLPITSDRIQEYAIPDPGCNGADNWRPWALKYRDGVLYVGGVCSAESTGNPDDLSATVYSFAKGKFSTVLSMNLNYQKGYLNDNYCGNFRPWLNDFYSFKIGSDVVCGPVPIFSDIEFDSEGNMLLSFGDRFGHQSGGWDFGTDKNDKRNYVSFSGGDLLKAFYLKGEYLVEKNATSGFFTTAGNNNKQGVNGGEFYYQDAYVSHQESVLGSVAVHPSYNTVVATLMDPGNIWSNGWSQLNNTDGKKNVNYHVFTGQFGTFGKASGLGDIELLIGSSTATGIGISIGNFLWEDQDEDGIQDAGEARLQGIKVHLCDMNGQILTSVVTNPNGEYFFSGLSPRQKYYLQIGDVSQYVNGLFAPGLTQYLPTIFQNRAKPGNKENDSDASQTEEVPISLKGLLAIGYTTGNDGENDFSIDFGLVPCGQKTKYDLRETICVNDSIQVGSLWFGASRQKDEVVLKNASYRGCDSTINVELTILPLAELEINRLFCPGEFVIAAGQLFNEANPEGRVVLRNGAMNNCDSVIDVRLSYYPTNQLWLPKEYEILYGDNVQLLPVVDRPFISYKWIKGFDLSCVDCFSPVASPFITNDYVVHAVDEYGCQIVAETRIVVKKDKTVYVPNIFTPNGDGRNDKFTLYGNRFLTLIEELRIYDRWGNLESVIKDIPPNDITYGWDGTVEGVDVVPGVFVYVARVRFLDNSTETLSGDVTVMR